MEACHRSLQLNQVNEKFTTVQVLKEGKYEAPLLFKINSLLDFFKLFFLRHSRKLKNAFIKQVSTQQKETLH